jgi:hypothetical protein
METGKGKKRLESSWAITLLAQIVLVGPGEKSTAANGWLSVRFFFFAKGSRFGSTAKDSMSSTRYVNGSGLDQIE